MAYNYIVPAGVIVPDTSQTQAEAQAEIKAALGQNISVSPDTPQGVIITTRTLERDALARNNAELANMINPNLAGGIFLDAIAALTQAERQRATRTVVEATITGVANTTIPAGSRARTAANDIFLLMNTVIIPSGGTINANFRAEQYGAVPCATGELTFIVDGILGWESVTNAADGAIGRNVQSDYRFRVQRRRTLAGQGVTIMEAIVSGVYAVEGVQSLSFKENYTSSPITFEGVSIAAHSIYLCVNGGTDNDVAVAMLRKKSMGCGWNGAITVNLIEPFSGESYAVQFDRPTPVPIKARVWVRVTDILVDAVETVRKAIVDYANGDVEGEEGFVVGGDVSTWELGGAIHRAAPSLYVQKIEISDDDGVTWQTDEIEIKVNEIATIIESAISVTVVT